MANELHTLTDGSKILLTTMIFESEYENVGTQMNDDLRKFSSKERGHLTDLKKKGFVRTMDDPNVPGYLWVIFEEKCREVYNIIKGITS